MNLRPFLVLLVLLVASPAIAQSQNDFVKALAGNWQVYDHQLSSGSGQCSLEFGTAAKGSTLSLVTKACAAPVGSAVAWSIDGPQLVLLDAQNKSIVRLGGNQKRLTGTTPDGMPIVIERAGGDGGGARLQGAYNMSGCYYVGYTQNCAPQAELARPALENGTAKIQFEVNAALHSEPRSDASVVGTVKQGACVVINACVVASDGAWCRIPSGSTGVWARKMTLRQNRWPIITFANSCG